MLPAAYQLPAAAVLVAGGFLACFFGHRMFRTVLAIFGFILGGLAASSLFGVSDTKWMLVAAIVGGLVGAFIMIAAYFVGVALVGAAMGAATAHAFFAVGDKDPSVFVVVLMAVAGSVAATYLQRYVIIVGTAFGGAWTLIVGVMALLGNRAALAAATAGDVWVAYPLSPAPGQRWVLYAWIALSVVGTGVQLSFTAGSKGRIGRRRK